MENENNNSRVRNMTTSVNDGTGTAPVPRSQKVAPSLRSGSTARERNGQPSSAARTRSGQPTSTARTRSGQPSSAARTRSGQTTSAARTRSGQSASSARERSAQPASAARQRSQSSAATGTRSSQTSAADSIKRTQPSYRSENSRTTQTRNNRPSQASAARKSAVNTKKPAVKKTKTASKRNSIFAGTWFGQRSGFTRFLIIYGVAFILLIIIAAIALSSYLRKFEAGQPTHVVEKVIQSFGSEDKLSKFLTDNKEIISPDMEGFEDTYYPLIAGKELNFVSDSENTTQEISSYYITADNSKVAQVTLAKAGSDSWEISGLDLSAAYNDAKEYQILVPEGSSVMINGKVLGPEKITGTGIPVIIEYASQFISSKPEFTTYSVKSITGAAPSVSGTDASGQELVFTESDTLFVAGGGADQAFVDSVKARVEAGVDSYALYFEYLAFDLSDYIVEKSLTYEQIFGSENYDRIDPSLYMFEYIKTNEFTEKTISNYTVYSDDCFTCDVKFNLLITFYQDGIYGPKDLPDDNIAMNATWVWVKEGDTWRIADIVLKG